MREEQREREPQSVKRYGRRRRKVRRLPFLLALSIFAGGILAGSGLALEELYEIAGLFDESD
ncbi:MAG: hypothetical protein LUE63_04050 [Lachnospiraceae bacterium]|nr:hypothetical protein [Lachnospiraceae bacterium]